MNQPVTAIFDIGKTNKKLLLFNEKYELIFEHEEKFEETVDDDDFPCDDLDRIETWMKTTIDRLSRSTEYDLKAVNFTTYGASVVYLDADGNRIGQLYNYLKTMPEDIPEKIYAYHGGKDEFTRKTASPASGMLNAGMQIFWLKETKPDLYARVKHVLNFPQYLNYLFTGKIVSDYTYVGCHTAMWDFDNMKYHPWLKQENIYLQEPLPSGTSFQINIHDKTIRFGIGLHDSSASLVPYLAASNEPFILCSTGTWIIFMNPFNNEALTTDQLNNGCLCYLSTEKKQVKSSLIFLGHVHNVNMQRIANYFNVDDNAYRKVTLNPDLLTQPTGKFSGKRFFFAAGIPQDYVDQSADLSQFSNFSHAYHRLMTDVTQIAWEALQSVLPANDQSKTLFISGGFNRNEIFTHLLGKWLPGKKIVTSEVKNATALGAAMIL